MIHGETQHLRRSNLSPLRFLSSADSYLLYRTRIDVASPHFLWVLLLFKGAPCGKMVENNTPSLNLFRFSGHWREIYQKMRKCCHSNNAYHTHDIANDIQRRHRAISERYGPCHGAGYGKMISYLGEEILEMMPCLLHPRMTKLCRCPFPCSMVSNSLVIFAVDFVILTPPVLPHRSHVLEKVCMYFTYKVRYTNSSTEIPEFPIEAPIALELLMAANFLDC